MVCCAALTYNVETYFRNHSAPFTITAHLELKKVPGLEN